MVGKAEFCCHTIRKWISIGLSKELSFDAPELNEESSGQVSAQRPVSQRLFGWRKYLPRVDAYYGMPNTTVFSVVDIHGQRAQTKHQKYSCIRVHVRQQDMPPGHMFHTVEALNLRRR